MDDNTRQRNRENSLKSRECNRRPRVSQRFLASITTYLSGNPGVNRSVSAETKEYPNSKFSKLIVSEFEEENSRSSDTMKVEKKSVTQAKVSDSFPKTPACRIRRRRLENVVLNVKSSVMLENIPLPGEEPENSAQTNSGLDQNMITPSKSYPTPHLQISLTRDNKESNPSTSPVSSRGSSENLSEERKEFLESRGERIASQVRDSLYEPSPVHETTVRDHRTNTSKYDADSSLSSSYGSPECTKFHFNTHLNHSYPDMQFKDNYEDKTDFKERVHPVQRINYPNFQTPPPTVQPRWSTSSSSRVVCLPVTANLSRPTACNAPWLTHSRSKSWNHPSTFSTQEEQVTSSNMVRAANWRKSQESSVQQDSAIDTLATSASPVSHWRNQQRYSPYDMRSIRTRAHLQDAISRRSYERLPKVFSHEGTMTRANSIETVSIRSLQTQQSMEPSCFYHLSPDRVYRHPLRQRKFEANSPKRRGDENSSTVSPYMTWSPPKMHLLPPFFLPVQEPDDPLEPNFMGHQLLGDSQLLRFARQILGKANRTSEANMRYLGLCVSGQTIQELLQKIKAKFYPVGDKIVLMIGTNNFLQNHRVDDITCAWDELISHLLCVQSRRLLLLTVPPIPKLADNESHWEELNQVNTFIRGYAGGSTDLVTVADISSLFLSGPKQCCVDYFEKTYGDTDRVDLIHLNERGFTRLHDFLIDNFMF